jgi:hypothetical protein
LWLQLLIPPLQNTFFQSNFVCLHSLQSASEFINKMTKQLIPLNPSA